MPYYVCLEIKDTRIERVYITPHYEKTYGLQIIATSDKFCIAYNYARELADKYNAILEWDEVFIIFLILKNGRIDRVLISSKPEDCIYMEYKSYLTFTDAYMFARDIADMYDALLEWYIEDELKALLETTLTRPVT